MLYDGDTFEHEGLTFRVTFPHDDTQDAPWEREDGHGPVSDMFYWRPGQGVKPPKRAGELLLFWDGYYRTYDFAEACRIARRDGWGSEGDEGLTPRAKAAKAAHADFKRLSDWCNDRWTYVGVHVELVDMNETESLWGIESDCEEYLEETAHELAGEIIARLQAAA